MASGKLLPFLVVVMASFSLCEPGFIVKFNKVILDQGFVFPRELCSASF